MSKKRAPREPSEKKQVPDGDVEIILRVPEGAELPKGLGRLQGPARKGRPRLSRGLTVEQSPGAFWKQLAEERKNSDPQSEFSRTWDECETFKDRIRDTLHNLKSLCSSDVFTQINQLVEYTLTAERCRVRLLNKCGGIGGSATLGLEWGLDKLRGVNEANIEKAVPVAELEHKVALLRMDEPDAKPLARAEYLLKETEADSHRCHACQSYERAVADARSPQTQRCERYQHYSRCKPCDVCRAWHMRLSGWLQKRSKTWDEDNSGQWSEVDSQVREKRNKEALSLHYS